MKAKQQIIHPCSVNITFPYLMALPDGEMTKQEAIGTIITIDKNIFTHVNRKRYLATSEWIRTSRAKHLMGHGMES